MHNMSNYFSVLMDESNDKQDNSCIILVRVLDAELGNVKEKVSRHTSGEPLKAKAFMSDATNVMKGA